MSDYIWLCTAAIISICIAYMWAFQLGYKRGCQDTAMEDILKKAEDKAKEKIKKGDF